jgi:hypothetical protein
VEDLVQWLRAQLDEDERIARAATPGPWRQHDTHLGQYGHTATVLSGEGNDTDLRAWLPSMSQESWDEARNVWNDAVHIAEHGPARVLQEIDAKRDLLRFAEGVYDHHETFTTGVAARLEKTLRLYALAYVDRPGYLESWRP